MRRDFHYFFPFAIVDGLNTTTVIFALKSSMQMSTVLYYMGTGGFGLFDHLVSWQYWPQLDYNISYHLNISL